MNITASAVADLNSGFSLLVAETPGNEIEVESIALAAGMPIIIFFIMGAKIVMLPKRRFKGNDM